MYSRILVLSLCLFVPFIVSRIVGSTLFLETGFFSTSLIDPEPLAVRELKLILALRGVSYVGVLEKQELINLILSSGQLSAGELAEAKAEVSSDNLATYFTGGNHFHEEVENAKGSVWLTQVIPTHSKLLLLDDQSWKQVRDELQPFGIRTGIFNCQLDPKLCKTKRWLQKRQLILTMPQGGLPKDSVAFSSSSKSSSVISWIRNELNSRIKRIKHSSELEKTWLRFDSGSYLSTKVRIVVLLPNGMEPPLFFSSLSAQFNGRMTFGVLNIPQADPLFRELPHLENCSSASYVIITPEGIFEYGKRVGEHLNFKRMELMLRTLQPEMNDVFIWSLTIVSFLVLLNVLFIYDEVWNWKNIKHWFWLVVKNNLLLCFLWSSISYALDNEFYPVTTISNILLKLTRQFSILEISSVLRNDFVFWKSHSWLIIGIFMIICAGHYWIRKRRLALTILNESENDDFISEIEINIRRPARGIMRENISNENENDDFIREVNVRSPAREIMRENILNGNENEDFIREINIRRRAREIMRENIQNGNEIDDFIREINIRRPAREIARGNILEILEILNRPIMRIAGPDLLLVELVNNLPLRKHCSTEGIEESNTPGCVICIQDYLNNESICDLPCNHNYHEICIKEWILNYSHRCPICRESIRPVRN